MSAEDSLQLFEELQAYPAFKELKKKLIDKFPEQQATVFQVAVDLIIDPPKDIKRYAKRHNLSTIEVFTVKTIIEGIKDTSADDLSMFG